LLSEGLHFGKQAILRRRPKSGMPTLYGGSRFAVLLVALVVSSSSAGRVCEPPLLWLALGRLTDLFLRATDEQPLNNLSAAVHSHSWTDLGKKIPPSGSATIALDAAFNCSDYERKIVIPTGTNVTILGNGAVLDAAQKGGFFVVLRGAALALDHLVLRHGSARGTVRQIVLPIHCSRRIMWSLTCKIPR
jgi:hypothetical protein